MPRGIIQLRQAPRSHHDAPYPPTPPGTAHHRDIHEGWPTSHEKSSIHQNPFTIIFVHELCNLLG